MYNNRYSRYINFIQPLLFLKSCAFSPESVSIDRLNVTSGPFRTNDNYLRRNLMLLALTGALPHSLLQFHGKKKISTTTDSCDLRGKQAAIVLGKLVFDVLIYLHDFHTVFLKRSGVNHFSFRVRHRLEGVVDLQDLI
jgi:hypothetical protein